MNDSSVTGGNYFRPSEEPFTGNPPPITQTQKPSDTQKLHDRLQEFRNNHPKVLFFLQLCLSIVVSYHMSEGGFEYLEEKNITITNQTSDFKKMQTINSTTYPILIASVYLSYFLYLLIARKCNEFIELLKVHKKPLGTAFASSAMNLAVLLKNRGDLPEISLAFSLLSPFLTGACTFWALAVAMLSVKNIVSCLLSCNTNKHPEQHLASDRTYS